jgi:hypothetical protein
VHALNEEKDDEIKDRVYEEQVFDQFPRYYENFARRFQHKGREVGYF